MSGTLQRFGAALGRLLQPERPLQLEVGAEGLRGEIAVPDAGDGRWEIVDVRGRACLSPREESHYLYCVLPEARRQRLEAPLWVEVEYDGDRYGLFRLQYASSDLGAAEQGLYKPAEQRWAGDQGLRRFRRAVFPLLDFDPGRTQNHGASFRLEFREALAITALRVHREVPECLDELPATAPLPELKKLPGRFYPINYLFIEITNACNFKCTWCPDEIMDRRRGFMGRDDAFRLLDQIAEKKAWLGPLYPVKLHQMGEPFLHPHLVDIVARAEDLGVGIELNTNCGLLTPDNVEGLYRAGLTNLILSYQTPDAQSFTTRKAPRLSFEQYRERVRMAVERKVALGATTHLEIDIMNTKHAGDFSIVSEDEQALAFMQDWIGFAQDLERRHGLPARDHDWDVIRSRGFLDTDENGSRYTLLDGVDLIWKRCHSWGNVIGTGQTTEIVDTYCPAPYDQLVVQWNGDVTTCCTDYEGRTKHANVFVDSIEEIWTGETLRRRRRDMLEGRLLDVCARCEGVK